VAQVVECLPSKYKALNLNASTTLHPLKKQKQTNKQTKTGAGLIFGMALDFCFVCPFFLLKFDLVKC
jgi:alkyl hydroperoxide reductase subunit AhpC